MKTEKKKKRRVRLKVLPSGDWKSRFRNPKSVDAKEVLHRLGMPRTLLSSSSKVRKSQGVGYLARVLYLSPGCYCPAASDGCLASCLGHSSGYMKEERSRDARDRRTALYASDPEEFMRILKKDLLALCCDAEEQRLLPACRLNGTSDVPYELLHREIFEIFDNIQFYDYTKLKYRTFESLRGVMGDGKPWPKNYSLCFSLNETNAHEAKSVLVASGTVAAVFWPEFPKSWMGYPVIDGDRNDVRWMDPPGTVVGLLAKGFVAQDDDETGFVIRTDRPDPSLHRRFASTAA